jgi:HK97 gp10 family phage protein
LIKLKLSGLDALRDQLTAVQNTMRTSQSMKDAARKAFLPVLNDAKSLVVEETEILKDSLKLVVQSPKDNVINAQIRVGKKASWRWHFVEFGAHGQPARPFLRPAFDRNRHNIPLIFGEEIRKAIQRAVKAKRVG